MTNRKLVLYLHLIWGTMDGNPWITSKIERSVFRCIGSQIQKLGCEMLAINGIPDHIHLVVKLKSTVTVAQLVKQAKGVSSKYINEHLDVNEIFHWHTGYGAFTVSRWDLPMIINYIKNQKKHHNEGLIKDYLE